MYSFSRIREVVLIMNNESIKVVPTQIGYIIDTLLGEILARRKFGAKWQKSPNQVCAKLKFFASAPN